MVTFTWSLQNTSVGVSKCMSFCHQGSCFCMQIYHNHDHVGGDCMLTEEAHFRRWSTFSFYNLTFTLIEAYMNVALHVPNGELTSLEGLKINSSTVNSPFRKYCKLCARFEMIIIVMRPLNHRTCLSTGEMAVEKINHGYDLYSGFKNNPRMFDMWQRVRYRTQIHNNNKKKVK